MGTRFRGGMRGWWVLGVVLALANGKDCPISIPHVNDYSYICDAHEVSFLILNDDATSRTPCATALLPAATTSTPQFATATCPDQTIDGVTRKGVIKCLMYAGVGSAAQCPTTDCDTDNFPDEQACDTCNRIGKGCDECEFLPRELGQACVGLNSCSVGATATEWVSAGGAQIAFKSEKDAQSGCSHSVRDIWQCLLKKRKRRLRSLTNGQSLMLRSGRTCNNGRS